MQEMARGREKKLQTLKKMALGREQYRKWINGTGQRTVQEMALDREQYRKWINGTGQRTVQEMDKWHWVENSIGNG